MKIIKSETEIIPQEPGIIGMKKHIELVGRVAYKSEDRITSDSYEKFLRMIHNRGHWAVFDLGTVYLQIPTIRVDLINALAETKPFTKLDLQPDYYFVTTNYRIICQLGLEEEMETYWSEPTDIHYHRVTARFVCSRGIAQEILRHKLFCPVMESTRYVNYSKDKFGSELTYILPQWIYRVREDIGTTIDSLTGELRDEVLTLDGQELWNKLCCEDRTVASRDNFLKAAEDEYFFELQTDESMRLKPEEARGVLPADIKTEVCLTGYVKDWMYEAPTDSPEKAGFFKLRCDRAAHPDVKVLADELLEKFKVSGINKLK